MNYLQEIQARAWEEIKAAIAVTPGTDPADVATCGHCGRSWNDAASTSVTPAPSGRCPFEYEHTYPDSSPGPDHFTVDLATARQILDQIWAGISAGCHDSRLYDSLIRAGWPIYEGSDRDGEQETPPATYAGGEAGLCINCQQPIQRCQHPVPCGIYYEHSLDLIHTCHGGTGDTVAQPLVAAS
jgi:hypothetical protein